MGKLIYESWKGYNFDSVEEASYTVLLQYHGNQSRPNRLELRGSGGEVIYEAAIQQEKPLLPQERDPSVAPPFNAYSGTGNASVRPHTTYTLVETYISLSLSGASGVCQLWESGGLPLSQHYPQHQSGGPRLYCTIWKYIQRKQGH